MTSERGRHQPGAESLRPGDVLDDYDYPLPKELIAHERRAAGTPSRLMVLHRRDRGIECGTFADLPRHLRPGDLIVRNDTRVMPARLRAVRTRQAPQTPEGVATLEVELLLCHPTGPGEWEALARPARRLALGDLLTFRGLTTARVTGVLDEGIRRVTFESAETALETMRANGEMPLPPYIEGVLTDPEKYQTSYAAREGAVAAPTAGFHFSEADFEELTRLGVELADVTLHVGPGTFQPMRSRIVAGHRMHAERFEVASGAREKIERARREGRRIVALGTTSVRVLETLAARDDPPGDVEGWTDLFIRPGHRFSNVDAMITNFHLPRTSLLVLVSAFAGLELARDAYARAIAERFRFYSFGDGMLIL